MKKVVTILAVLSLAGCGGGSGSGGGVMDKVLTDFGVREAPEGHEEPSDRVFAKLDAVGQAELERMNSRDRHGEIKFQDEDGLGGVFYKEVKIYEDYRPLDAQRLSRTSQSTRGYVGYIDYTYRIYQSERRATRTEAQALSATIPVGSRERETYRYHFGASGEWNGGAGERSNE